VYTIAFNFPNLPKGGEIDITGLNQIFKNGNEYTIDAHEAELFRIANQRPVVSDKPQDLRDGVDWEKGPTLLEAFKDNPGVTVTVAKGNAPQEGGNK
jgi:hypothetical protein